jgi:hypothetical protein
MARTIGDLTQAVNRYDFCKREIPDYHHWRYALPLAEPMPEYDIVLWRMAPKEEQHDWTLHPGHTFESVGFSWRERVGAYTQEIAEWRSLVAEVCQTEAVIQSNWFFWSTPDLGDGFKERYGQAFHNSIHHHFCWIANSALIEVVQPRLVVVPDFEEFALLTKFYDYGLSVYDSGDGWSRCHTEDGTAWLVMDEWTPESLREGGDWIADLVAEALEDW